jgi:hypothetical protein
MSQTAREKIALVVFGALVIMTLLGGIWYLNVGHSWNVAATSIDDAAGTLDGYTAIVYDGVTVPSVAEATANTAPVTSTSVVKSYRDKKASVITLDLVDPKLYADGLIIKKGSHRFGVFYVDSKLPETTLQKQVKYFQDARVDYIICITTDSDFVSGRITGTDIAISTKNEDKLIMGKTIDGTYFTESPCTGKIGTVLISRSNVVSSKDIDKL